MKTILTILLFYLLTIPVPTHAQSSLALSENVATLVHAQYFGYDPIPNVGPTDYAYADYRPVTGYGGVGQFPSSINLAGVNAVSVTWSAPAGYMYVVTPPPATNPASTLFLGLGYGTPGAAATLGSVTHSSASFGLVYGTAPGVYGSVSINNDSSANWANGLFISGGAYDLPGTSGYAFTNFTITAQFSGALPSGILNVSKPYNYANPDFDIALYGGYVTIDNGFQGPPDPGPLLTLEPVTTPEPSSVALLSVAAAVYFARRKMRP
jgi:hypothetical protein